MAFFESIDSHRCAMRPLWKQGAAAYKSAPSGEKPIIGAAGALGSVAGTLWTLPKTAGVAAFEYYDFSFGKSRGRDFFDYVTSSPLVHTLALGVAGALVGMSGVAFPPAWGIANSFTAGVVGYLASQVVFRALPRVFWANVTGLTGKAMSLAHGGVTSLKQPLDPNAVNGRRDVLGPPR